MAWSFTMVYEVINMTRGARVDEGRPDRRRRVAWVVALAMVGSLLAACSGGGSSSTSSSASGGSAPNKTAMASVLLRASDFPTGWIESSKPQSTSDDAATKKAASSITACREFVAQSDIEKRHVKSSSTTFTDSTMSADAANEASNQVVGYSSEAQAKTAYAAYASAQTGTCLQQVFDKILNEQVASINAKGGPVATVTADVQRVGVPSAGDATTAYEVVVSIDVAGAAQQQLGFVVQIVRLNQYVVSYNATTYQPVPDKFGENLVDRSMGRLEAALSA